MIFTIEQLERCVLICARPFFFFADKLFHISLRWLFIFIYNFSIFSAEKNSISSMQNSRIHEVKLTYFLIAKSFQISLWWLLFVYNFCHFRWSIDFFFVMWFEQAKKRFKWTELKIGKLKKLKAKGHTDKEIAKMLGTSYSSVNNKWNSFKVTCHVHDNSSLLFRSHERDYK